MNYAQIRHYDTANGKGIRASVFVSGCTHKCYNCFNKEYQDFAYGKEFTDLQVQQIINYLKEDVISGLTVLGGEPLQQDIDQMITFLKLVKEETRKSIWIYSGYTYEEIESDDDKKRILPYFDILVDGRFVERLKNLRLKFRGSSNQRIIDVQESLRQGKAVDISDKI